MGQEVSRGSYSREDRLMFRAKVLQDLDVFERMLEASQFDFTRPQMGLEIELNLACPDDGYRPAMNNRAVLDELADVDFQAEVGRFNIEMNVPPRPLAGEQSRRLDAFLNKKLRRAGDAARAHGAVVVAIGILPTLMAELFEGDWISDGMRYTALNDSVLRERGEGMELDIEGPSGERVAQYFETVGPLSGCTSVQLHQQVTPQDFPTYWNAAQVISAVQIAIGANSPFLFGRRLWAETRIPLFTQMIDTRSVELVHQHVRPRAYFGRRWITSIFDLFEENVNSYPALLPESTDEDPVGMYERGETPGLGELRLHNGTVYRWNRPIYDRLEGLPHLRVENRVLPAGPSVPDMIANALLYYGLLESLTSSGRPLWTKMTFDDAEANFFSAARHGIDADLTWPGFGRVGATTLVSEHLLTVADDGLASLGLRRDVRAHYLDIIEGRCRTRTNGASWQVAAVEAFEAAGRTREEALSAMLAHYVEHMDANAPVHTWPQPEPQPSEAVVLAAEPVDGVTTPAP